jgi:predicted transposase/invertase (TIGR01784 family)
MTENNTQLKKAYYIVTNAQGEEFLLPYYSETFRVLMDDKDTIRDMLNCLLGLDSDHEIIDLDYEFEKPIDVFMPEDDSARLDVWVTTKDNRYFNIEMQNRSHPFFLDRLQLYNSYQTLRGKYEYNRSAYFKSMDEKERKVHFYELPEMVSIWLCNFPILKSENIFKDSWAVYSENEVLHSDTTHKALPIFTKNRYIVVDLPNFKRIRKNISSREDYWLKLLSQGPLEVPESKDPIFREALNRLRVSRISPELLKALEEHMFDKHADEAIEAEIWLKAEAQGLAKGLEQGHIEMALAMLADNKPIEEIVKYSHLPESKVLELKQSQAKETRK